MIQRLSYDHAAADLAAVEDLLATLPQEDVLGRLSLESRRQTLSSELESLATGTQKSLARTTLLFGGAPVVGSRGINAEFAAEALNRFESLVGALAVGQRRRSKTSAQSARRDDAKLHLTGIVHGSFGFELSQLDDQGDADDGRLTEAVVTSARALVAAADGDEALADEAQKLDKRAFAALREFFALLKKDAATLRVVAGDIDRRFSHDEISSAAERTAASDLRQEEIAVQGELLGILPESRRFEFRLEDGKTVRGAVVDSITPDELREMSKLATSLCTARMVKVTLVRGGRQRSRFGLLGLDAGSPPNLPGAPSNR